MKKAVFVYSPEFEKNAYPAGHPFDTSRAKRVREVLNSMGLLRGQGRSEIPPVPAERVVLKKFHTARYLQALKAASRGNLDATAMTMGIGSSDCPAFPGLYEYSVLAVGATLTGVREILAGRADIAFNPSGGFHHAHAEQAAGFCYINDVGLACMVLAEAGKRVLYLDVDVHHGDGVAYAFYDRPDVMTISFHENPRILFPGTGFEDEIGTGEGKGYCVNVPLPVGTYDEMYIKAYREVAVPLITAFKPDAVVFELGADALAGDPLAHLYLSNNVYVEIIKHLLSLNKPIMATGGGGYNVENTVRAWALAWSVFSGADEGHDMSLGTGGVMLASTEWQGGLRDRDLVVTRQQREIVPPAVNATIEKLRKTLFPIHGLI